MSFGNDAHRVIGLAIGSKSRLREDIGHPGIFQEMLLGLREYGYQHGVGPWPTGAASAAAIQRFATILIDGPSVRQ